MADPEQKRRCPTCRHLLDADAFYANCAECKDCKRRRSQRNRALQDLAAGRVPSKRRIKRDWPVGFDAASDLHDHLAAAMAAT